MPVSNPTLQKNLIQIKDLPVDSSVKSGSFSASHQELGITHNTN
jgi:hypothetical protein